MEMKKAIEGHNKVAKYAQELVELLKKIGVVVQIPYIGFNIKRDYFNKYNLDLLFDYYGEIKTISIPIEEVYNETAEKWIVDNVKWEE